MLSEQTESNWASPVPSPVVLGESEEEDEGGVIASVGQNEHLRVYFTPHPNAPFIRTRVGFGWGIVDL